MRLDFTEADISHYKERIEANNKEIVKLQHRNHVLENKIREIRKYGRVNPKGY